MHAAEQLGSKVREAVEALARIGHDRDAAIAVMLRLMHLRFSGVAVRFASWAELLAALPRDGGLLDPSRFPCLESARIGHELVRLLCDAVQDASPALDIEEFGHVYESLLDRGTRRASGSHYTPKLLTELLVRHTLDPLAYIGPAEGRPREEWHLRPAVELLSLRICDPACGAGAFLLQVCRYLGDRLEEAGRARDGVERCVFGVDKNPLAVEIAKLSMELLTGVRVNDSIRCGDSLSEPISGGFDAIVCNPPFVNAIEGEIDDDTKRRLKRVFPALGGTADYAYYFLERSRQLILLGGTIGFILPRSFLVAPAAKSLRLECSPSLIATPESSTLFRTADVFIALVVLGGGPCRGGRTLDPAHWKPLRIETDNWWSPLIDRPAPVVRTGPVLGLNQARVPRHFASAV